MKIAYYEENNYHTEIMGMFLEYFSNSDTEITVYNSADMSSSVDYFKKFSNFSLKLHKELINEYDLYDKIIVGSAGNTKDLIDKIDQIDYNKFIFICHLSIDIKKQYKNIIVLTPLNCKIIINPNIKYCLPIHNYIKDVVPFKKNILTIIGRFKDINRDTNDLVNLINKYYDLDFTVQIFVRATKFVPKVLLNLSKKYPNKFKIFLKTSSEKMDEYLKMSKYILPLVSKNSWYHKDRLSGNIALAYNYNVPLIIDEQLQEIYQIKNCITYKNSLSEIIEQIVLMDEQKYNQMVSKFIQSKNEIITNNNSILKQLICE